MRDVFFGQKDVKLNGVLASAQKPGAPAVVLCHPHPQFGGSMDNNVVLGLESVLSGAGMTTLRFNFRGVGRSAGSFSGGDGERDDVTSAIDFLALDDSVGDVYVCGYSFGAIAGLRAATVDERVSRAAGVMPPTTLDPFDFLSTNSKPLLLIAGAQDDFCDVDRVKTVAEASGAKLKIMPDADHFLMGRERSVAEIVLDFFKAARE